MSELVTDYLDRALPWSMRSRARLHLFLCHSCRRYFAQMRQTVRLLAGAPLVAPAPAIEAQLLAAVRAPPDTAHRPGDGG